MKVLQVKEPKVAVYTDEYPTPVPKDDEVVIKVIRNGICATDLAILSGEASFMHDGSTSYPVRFGHEVAGKVVAVGKNVTRFKIGDTAVPDDSVSCGECEACRSGQPKLCPNLRAVGTLNTYPGTFAEYACFPERCMFEIPSEFSYDEVALLEPAAISMSGVKKSHIVPGESYVLITGVGAIGLAAAALAKHAGAKKVFISGRTPYKLEIAKKMGADAACNSREESLVDFIARETDGHGVDCLIECSGNPAVLDDCINVLAKNGTMTLISFYEKPIPSFNLDKFILKNCRMETVLFHETIATIQAVKEGVDLTPMITRHIKFDECAEVMTQMINAPAKENIKVMVDFD